MGGGWGVLSADEISRTGLTLAELPPEVIAEIDEVLPPFWSHGNPVDLVGTMSDHAPERAVEAVVRSDVVDAVIVLGIVGERGRPAEDHRDGATHPRRRFGGDRTARARGVRRFPEP